MREADTAGGQRATGQVEQQARHGVVYDPTAVTHLVCCRAPSWDQAICGYTTTGGALNGAAGDQCAMCVHQARSLWAARGQQVLDEHCPLDGTPCPTDEWLMERMARETH